jgi:hypothetical protein
VTSRARTRHLERESRRPARVGTGPLLARGRRRGRGRADGLSRIRRPVPAFVTATGGVKSRPTPPQHLFRPPSTRAGTRRSR